MDAGKDITVRIDAATHFEWIDGIKIRITIGAIMAIGQESRCIIATLEEGNGISQHVGPAGLRPLITVHYPATAGDGHLNRTATGRGSSVDVDQAIYGSGGVRRSLSLSLVGRRKMDQEPWAGTIGGRR